MVPFQDDPLMLDYSEDNLYSEHMAKLVAWHRRYTRFWKQSTLYCDFLYPDFMNPTRPDKRGMVGEGEQKFLNAVTGKDFSFADGIETGRKIWNLDNAIWTLQGRHRDMVKFAGYIHNQPLPAPAFLPGRKDGKWEYVSAKGRVVDREKFEEWKTRYYQIEGWDVTTGWPTKQTLESMGMKKAARELQDKNKLGRG
jgi:aldehyde:ferredoxin oxidoreductase